MAVEVKVPGLGESVQEAMIHKWRKKSGDIIRQDEVLLDLESDKATVEIVAETGGKLEILKKEGETVKIGEILAKIDTSVKPSDAPAPTKAAEEVPQKASSPAPAQSSASNVTVMPSAQRMISENKLDPAAIGGTGKDGRVTKEDVVHHMQGKPAAAAGYASGNAAFSVEVSKPLTAPPSFAPAGTRQVRKEPMSMIRRRIAERLVQAQSTAAILTTFNEVDMSAVMQLRKEYKEKFEKKYGFGLGFMGFFVKATIEALRQFPQVNGGIEGNDIILHDYFDIGIAVSTERGLMVPVIRNAETLSLAQVEHQIAEYGKKARENRITMDELTGGTFTISNGGVFGSLLSTPILNPPQSAILGMHKIQERPVVVNGQVVVKPMMYLALSYDHRIIDGKESVQFLVKIKEFLEVPARLWMGV